ncbi:MAG TPA: carboxypeptidase regulatory-like domain-containing protein, partial [Chloroflexi bacterium]|nr:carboxypeptidase regulatory-like domain-containing protein [Chloroflexota bacterium]
MSASKRVWTVQTVDAPKYFADMTDRSLALDGNVHPHIAYGGDHLYYAYYDGSTWHREMVDASAGVGSHAAIAVTGTTAITVHISYYDAVNGDLKYARRDAGGRWITQTVDYNGNVGRYTSIALDRQGRPHISYYDVTNKNLKYAYWDGNQWHEETAH